MWVYPNGRKQWAFTKTSKGKEHTKYETFGRYTLAEVRGWAATLANKVLKGETLDEEKSIYPTFKEVFEEWYEIWKKDRAEKYTTDIYNMYINRGVKYDLI